MCEVKEIRIEENGFSSHHFEVHGEHEFIFHIGKHRNTSIAITYSGKDAQVKTRFICEEGSNTHVLLRNEVEHMQMMDESEIYKDAHLTLGYLEIQDGTVCAENNVYLKETGADAHLMNVCIAQSQKHYHVVCVHEKPYTNGLIENYAVVKEHGDYSMEACGKIVKGAHDSASHQASRVLTLSEQQSSEVIPLLLIDENDVKASHATTLGQPDENQLYYLQSRGLTREQALGLLTIGYMMPITTVLDDEDLAAELKNEIETKVGLHA